MNAWGVRPGPGLVLGCVSFLAGCGASVVRGEPADAALTVPDDAAHPAAIALDASPAQTVPPQESDAGVPDARAVPNHPAGADADAGVALVGNPQMPVHLPLLTYPLIPDQGGLRMPHPRLVTVTYAGDPQADHEEALVRYLAGSAWLAMVGRDYGVGTGTELARVRRGTAAPTTVTSDQIEAALDADVRAVVLPSPGDGRFDNTLYVIFMPATTRVTLSDRYGAGQSCVDFGGYHAAVTSTVGRLAYAVVDQCAPPDTTLTAEQLLQVVTSHELIEAFTDADPIDAPAFQFHPGEGAPWTTYGLEVGDVCLGEYITVDGYTLQRAWSNTAAAADTHPCIPVVAPGG